MDNPYLTAHCHIINQTLPCVLLVSADEDAKDGGDEDMEAVLQTGAMHDNGTEATQAENMG